MGDRFWKSFTRGRGAARRTLGEPVLFGTAASEGIVTDLRTEEKLVPGGGSNGLMFEVEVSVELGESIEDGVQATVRGETGRVTGKRHTGGGMIIEVGPANRWNGDF